MLATTNFENTSMTEARQKEDLIAKLINITFTLCSRTIIKFGFKDFDLFDNDKTKVKFNNHATMNTFLQVPPLIHSQ